MGTRRAFACAFVVASIGLAAEARPDPWRYTDEQGTVHFTDNPTNVPERYRASLEPMTLDAAPELQLQRQARPGGADAGKRGGTPRSGLEARLLEQARAQSGAGFGELEPWMRKWVIAFQVAGLPWVVIGLGCMLQVLRRRRWGWLLSITMLWPIGMPAYLLVGLDEDWRRSTRVMLLVLWSAPLVVMFGGMWMLVRQHG